MTPLNIEKITDIPYAAIIISATRSCKSDKVADVRAKIQEWKEQINADDL